MDGLCYVDLQLGRIHDFPNMRRPSVVTVKRTDYRGELFICHTPLDRPFARLGDRINHFGIGDHRRHVGGDHRKGRLIFVDLTNEGRYGLHDSGRTFAWSEEYHSNLSTIIPDEQDICKEGR